MIFLAVFLIVMIIQPSEWQKEGRGVTAMARYTHNTKQSTWEANETRKNKYKNLRRTEASYFKGKSHT